MKRPHLNVSSVFFYETGNSASFTQNKNFRWFINIHSSKNLKIIGFLFTWNWDKFPTIMVGKFFSLFHRTTFAVNALFMHWKRIIRPHDNILCAFKQFWAQTSPLIFKTSVSVLHLQWMISANYFINYHILFYWSICVQRKWQR